MREGYMQLSLPFRTVWGGVAYSEKKEWGSVCVWGGGRAVVCVCVKREKRELC